MVTQVPPMMCSEPQKFSEKLHEIKECNWQVNEGPYELVYLRPVLFYGRHGAVAAQGQVGNQECSAETVLNFAIPENKVGAKEEPKHDETKDKEGEGYENVMVEENSACATKPFVAEESKEKEDESEEGKVDTEMNRQKDEFDLSLDKDTVTSIPGENKQSGEIAETPFNKQNDDPNTEGTQMVVTEANCNTPNNKTGTETSNEGVKSGEPIQSSAIRTVSVIPNEEKKNSENQEIDSKEHNNEANNEDTQKQITEANCVTSDEEIETETTNKVGVSDKPATQSSEINTISIILDEDRQNGVTSDNKIETETPNEAGVSDKPAAQSSEIRTVSVIPSEEKQNSENQEIDSKEHNNEANNEDTQKQITEANCVTSNEEIEMNTK